MMTRGLSTVLLLHALGSFVGCSSDEASTPVETGCTSNQECDEGFVCMEGSCQEDGEEPLEVCTRDGDCADGRFCNGDETCDPDDPSAGEDGCVEGTSPDLDDGIDCTDDACDEDEDQVTHTPGTDCECISEDDPRCPAMFAGACETGTCDTTRFVCVQNPLAADTPCDDGITCTVGDACDGEGLCTGGQETDAECDDGLFCNGAESCDPDSEEANGDGCVRSEAPVIEDETPCTDDFCDENNDIVVHIPNDDCECNIDADCEPPDPTERNSCLRYICQPDTFTCISEPLAVGSDCNDGVACTENDRCNDQALCVGLPNAGLCDDRVFCNGPEFCVPEAEGRDEEGCVQGVDPLSDTPPQPSCVAVTCNENSNTVDFNTSNCECPSGEASECPSAPACQFYTCTEELTCELGFRDSGDRCDDGAGCTVNDTCNGRGQCSPGEPDDASCDDGAFCTGEELCEPNHPDAEPVTGCLVRNVPVIDDGIDCTDDRCDEDLDAVVHATNDGFCDNGLFCDGAETCDNGLGCVGGAPPQIDDGIGCTVDSCDDEIDAVTHTLSNAACDDGTFCNGAETCDPTNPDAAANGCLQDEPIDPDDGFECTFDACDEARDIVVNDPDNTLCDDTLFCNGVETCDPTNPDANIRGCFLSPPPEDDDNNPCTNASCNEEIDAIEHIDNGQCECQQDSDCPVSEVECLRIACIDTACLIMPLEQGEACNDGGRCTFNDVCDGAGSCEGTPSLLFCTDGAFCNGVEQCNPNDPNADFFGCAPGALPEDDDGDVCTDPLCNEDNDTIEHIDNDVCECRQDNDCPPAEDQCFRAACVGNACLERPLDQGTGCDDGIACTLEDVCDGNGACDGTPNDGQCDDTLFCNGNEACAPNDLNADNAGCIAGTEPEDDDGDVCTDPLCNEDNDTIEHIDNDVCECRQDSDCPPAEGQCFEAVCVNNACLEQPLDQGTGCDDGIACTANDVCDGNGACDGSPDDVLCDDDTFCNGNEACVPTDPNADNDGCIAGTSPIDDGVFCTDDVCDEDQDTVTHTPNNGHCDDNDICNGAEICDPDNDCQPGDPLDNGDSCGTINCGNGNQTAECRDGVCSLEPEGPTGTATCNDGIDNDCDLNTDDNDTDCATPGEVSIVGPDTAPGGLGNDGATLEVSSTGATNQTRNLYCVSRMLAHEESFDQTPQTHIAYTGPNDAQLQSRPNQVTFGVPFNGDTTTRGARVCDGFGAIWGPFDLPDPDADPRYGFVLTARLGVQSGELGPEEYMVLSYRTAGTGGKWLPLVMIGNGQDFGLRDYRYHFYNSPNVDRIEIRFEVIATNANESGDCGFVEDLRLSLAPTLPLDDDGSRLRPDWTFDYGDITQTARQTFQSVDPNDFFDKDDLTLGNFNFSLNEDASIRANQRGMRARVRGGSTGMAPMPEILTPMSFDRTNPLVFHMHAKSRSTEFNANEIAHIGYGIGLDVNNADAVSGARKLTSIMSDNPDGNTYYDTHFDLNTTQALENRYHLILPEEAKPLVGRRIGLVLEPVSRDNERTYIDEVELYVHTTPGTVDRTVTTLGPATFDEPTHLIQLQHATPGEAIVQCYWQIPDDANTATIASEPVRITFE